MTFANFYLWFRIIKCVKGLQSSPSHAIEFQKITTSFALEINQKDSMSIQNTVDLKKFHVWRGFPPFFGRVLLED